MRRIVSGISSRTITIPVYQLKATETTVNGYSSLYGTVLVVFVTSVRQGFAKGHGAPNSTSLRKLNSINIPELKSLH